VSGPKILLFGGTGQVGHELRRSLAPVGTVRAPSRPTVDLTEPVSLRTCVREAAPDVVVNAAAFTDVDGAEEAPEEALAVNGRAPGVLADAAESVDAWFVHYSTDYVFDGTKRSPYTEKDSPRPINVYGQTKWAGEQAVEAVNGRYLIFRTSWIYSDRRSNFLRTMLRLAEERERLTVVDDQIGTPTWAGSIARVTATVLRGLDGEGESTKSGTYHFSAAGQTSWYGFARAIFAQFGRDDVVVEPVSSDEYPTEAARPTYSVLDSSRLRQTFGVAPTSWTQQLKQCRERIVGSTAQ